MSGTVEDETWEWIKVRMHGDRGAVEYTAFILWLNWLIRMMQAGGTNDPSDEEIDQLIRDLESGAVEVPDYRDRIR